MYPSIIFVSYTYGVRFGEFLALVCDPLPYISIHIYISFPTICWTFPTLIHFLLVALRAWSPVEKPQDGDPLGYPPGRELTYPPKMAF